jgi:hypothetical protein
LTTNCTAYAVVDGIDGRTHHIKLPISMPPAIAAGLDRRAAQVR